MTELIDISGHKKGVGCPSGFVVLTAQDRLGNVTMQVAQAQCTKDACKAWREKTATTAGYCGTYEQKPTPSTLS